MNATVTQDSLYACLAALTNLAPGPQSYRIALLNDSLLVCCNSELT